MLSAKKAIHLECLLLCSLYILKGFRSRIRSNEKLYVSAFLRGVHLSRPEDNSSGTAGTFLGNRLPLHAHCCRLVNAHCWLTGHSAGFIRRMKVKNTRVINLIKGNSQVIDIQVSSRQPIFIKVKNYEGEDIKLTGSLSQQPQ